MVRHDVSEDADSLGVVSRNHLVKIGKGSQLGINIAVVGNVITAVSKSRWVEGAKPDGVNAKFCEVIDLGGDAFDIPKSITVGVFEGSWVHLVHNCLAPPIFVT